MRVLIGPTILALWFMVGGALGCSNMPPTENLPKSVPIPTISGQPNASPSFQAATIPPPTPMETPLPTASPTPPQKKPSPTEKPPQPIKSLQTRTGVCQLLCDREFWQGNPTEATVLTTIEGGEDPTAYGVAGLTPLHWAAGYSTPSNIAMLLDFGAEINALDDYGKTPLFLVGLNGSPEVARFLLTNGADLNIKDNQGWTPLHAISRRVPREVVEVLLEFGADFTAETDTGHTPLHQAAAFNSAHGVDVVSLLLDQGANVDHRTKTGTTPLHWAARNNPNTDTMALLIDRGAAVNAKNVEGWSVLHYAASLNGSEEVFQFLLDQGIDIDQPNPEEVTPLHIAAGMNSSPAVIRFLVEQGAEINRRDLAGWTPIHFAAGLDQKTAVVQALVDLGADLTATSNQLETACGIALAAAPTPKSFFILCADSGVMATPLTPAPTSTGSLETYQDWGEWINYGRNPTLKWADGSNWWDGKSGQPPSLPIPEAAYEEFHMTCAQSEVLLFVAFPEGEDVNNWDLKPNYLEVLEEWDANYATLVWGDHSQALQWFERTENEEWCGDALR